MPDAWNASISRFSGVREWDGLLYTDVMYIKINKYTTNLYTFFMLSWPQSFAATARIQFITSSGAVTVGTWPAGVVVTSTLLPVTRSIISMYDLCLSGGIERSPSATKYDTGTSLYPA